MAATVIDGPGPRDTKRYEITPPGWHALQDWVDSPLSEVARSEFMLCESAGSGCYLPSARGRFSSSSENGMRRGSQRSPWKRQNVLEGDAVDDRRLLSLPSTRRCAPASCTSR